MFLDSASFRRSEWDHYNYSAYVDRCTGYCCNAQVYLVHFDDGMFASANILFAYVVGVFMGILRTEEEYAARILAGFGGYAIQLNRICALDCYGIDDCRSSRANEAVNSHDEATHTSKCQVDYQSPAFLFSVHHFNKELGSLRRNILRIWFYVCIPTMLLMKVYKI